ncbi:hypothetical protein A0J57_11015 [Sphingobium sp. 22B]|jgi:copper resistance protein D|uniref:copper homeostasis membrane protein CopD n=1 Tax=unclassified Sphingobium TaxID=2611147 RepID=UPI0007809132|nr:MULTISPECIES: copper homeostasis membrane protein CopD [unclassified Sphingobium]KXU32297.1 hypothetical protein AXW74_07610 [Sphingobium sp. AM]KYC32189.1 hypothetical protein A0J57_11015 [Sphingobium sp. 22B]OAP31821.1 hypothetical protein A8O16_10815 [Sphingobium sp. 20006FA]
MGDLPAAAIRFAIYADLLGLFGLAAFLWLALGRSERHRAFGFPPPRVFLLLVVGAILLSGLGLMAVTAQMSGTAIAGVDLSSIRVVLFETSLGTSWIARIAALVLALSCTLTPRPIWPGIVISSGVALATLAWVGHGVMHEGPEGWVHLGADILHLIAAAGWFGSLVGFLLLLAASRTEPELLHVAHRALKGFATIGTGLVFTIILTGLINAWFTVGIGFVGRLLTSGYSILLLAKLALVMMMLALASINRFRFTPALGRSFAIGHADDARKTLWISVLAEAMLGVVVLAVVAWLGLLESPMST